MAKKKDGVVEKVIKEAVAEVADVGNELDKEQVSGPKRLWEVLEIGGNGPTFAMEAGLSVVVRIQESLTTVPNCRLSKDKAGNTVILGR